MSFLQDDSDLEVGLILANGVALGVASAAFGAVSYGFDAAGRSGLHRGVCSFGAPRQVGHLRVSPAASPRM